MSWKYDGAAAVAGARKALEEALATDGIAVSRLAALVNEIAYEEGRADAHERIAKAVRRGGKRQGLWRAMSMLALGADDDWSGRRNDVARARFDGMRRAVDDAKYDLELLWEDTDPRHFVEQEDLES